MTELINKRIGIFGGAFNPVHKGHIKIARISSRKYNLDKVIFVPTYISPHKSNYELAPEPDRLKMLRLALKNIPEFEVSDIELKRKGISYSVETLKTIKGEDDNIKLFFIVGFDNIEILDKWKDIETIFNLCEFIAVSRPGSEISKIDTIYRDKIKTINIKGIDIASSQIRELIKTGGKFEGYVLPEVSNYIKKNGLYKNN